jgi:hypothetical protein
MSVNDWFDNKVVWDLSDPNRSLISLMAPGTEDGMGNNRFKLKPKWRKGEIAYFTVNLKDSDLPAVWETVTLFPRGNVPAPAPVPALAADPDETAIQIAVDKVKTHLANHPSTTERLEGEIDMDGKRGSLTLLQIPNAFPLDAGADGNEAFLCMFVTFDPVQPGASNPDGTAGGHSVHP